MIFGRSRDKTYEKRENLYPGISSSDTAAPPTMLRDSKTQVLRPARARYREAIRPLWPAPIIAASNFYILLVTIYYSKGFRLIIFVNYQALKCYKS